VAEIRISGGTLAHQRWSDAQCKAVAEEMNRILDHPTFKSSKQCVALLHYLVNQVLDGNQEGIKERTLGVEVFGRDPNYDTNSDPIVRRTANEIRKRLAQCYQEPNYHYPVKIHLVRGSYLPEFEFASPGNGQEPIEAMHVEQSPEPFNLHLPSDTRFKGKTSQGPRNWILGIAATLLVLASSWLLLVRFEALRSPEYKIWKPLLNSGDWIMVCLSDADSQLAGSDGKSGSQAIDSIVASPQAPQTLGSREVPPSIPFIDAHVGHAITTRLLELKRRTGFRPSSELTLWDFRQRPAVLIGGSNNPWALILLSKLRYSIQVDPTTHDVWIQDAQNPSKRDWKIDGKLQSYADTPFDYAVVTRLFDEKTGQWIMALSGLEAYGTEAAGELVADPAFAKYLPATVRSTGNFQIVLKTSVLRGNTGPIEILAFHTW
jgi:hypothetical protein